MGKPCGRSRNDEKAPSWKKPRVDVFGSAQDYNSFVGVHGALMIFAVAVVAIAVAAQGVEVELLLHLPLAVLAHHLEPVP